MNTLQDIDSTVKELADYFSVCEDDIKLALLDEIVVDDHIPRYCEFVYNFTL